MRLCGIRQRADEQPAQKETATDTSEKTTQESLLLCLLKDFGLTSPNTSLMIKLQEFGVTTPEDIDELLEDDVKELKLSRLDERKFMRMLSSQKVKSLLTEGDKELLRATARNAKPVGKASSKFLEEPYALKTGLPVEAAKGLNARMNVEDDALALHISQGIKGIEDEIARFAESFRTPEANEVKQLLHYILYETSSEKEYPNSIRDKGRGGKNLDYFCQHEHARRAGLRREEVVAIRLYTTIAYKYINAPLRDDERHRGKMPCPLPVTTHWAQSGIKKLRNPDDVKGEVTLWRGMRNVKVAERFMEEGGTELGFMSTTLDLGVAVRYSMGGHSLLLKIVVPSFMQYGANVQWLSAFPDEAEILYPPLTYLHPTKRTEDMVISVPGGKVALTIVEVKPVLS